MTLNTRKLATALAVSLAFNLFALGFVAARVLFHPHGPHHAGAETGAWDGPGPGPGPAHEHGGRAFGPRAQQLIGARAPAMRAHRVALREARKAVGRALTAEPFDRAALERALSDLRARQSAAAEAAHAALVELAASLDAEGRRALAARGPR